MHKLIRRFGHLYWLLLSFLVKCFTNVHKKRVLCWSYYYSKYSCNPRYITEYLLKEHPGEYEIYWCFYKDVNIEELPSEIKVVRWRTWKYLKILNSSEFLFSNARVNLWGSSFIKGKKQKYIMTWHAGMGLKKVEKDAEDKLSKSYLDAAKYDSSICDLMLSGSKYMTETIRRAFWYNGNILECGTPRNDILFKDHTKLRMNIYNCYNIPNNAKILLYAPTFRSDFNLKYYKLDWQDVIDKLEAKFGVPFYVFIRLHPNYCSSRIDISDISFNGKVVDLTSYHDMQELLCISDILVTDYSSSMFDFSLLKKPCFLYALDYETYDRGTCFQLSELPFPYVTNNKDFLGVIENFDETKYKRELSEFNERIVGNYEKGEACENIYQWMKKNEN